MQAISDKLLSVLGKSPRQPEVRTVLSELQGFLATEKDGWSTIYNFPKKGVYFEYFRPVGCIEDAGFYLGDSTGWGDLFQGWKPFTGRLPFGIERSDTVLQVAKKLGTPADHEPVHKPVRLSQPEDLTGREEILEFWLQLEEGPYDADNYTFNISPFGATFTFLRPNAELVHIRVHKQMWAIRGFQSIRGGTHLENLKVLRIAHKEAHRLEHLYVGTEQILLGLILEGGRAASLLRDAGVSITRARKAVENIVGRGTGYVEEQPSFTPRAKHVLEAALRLAKLSKSAAPSSEQILIALLDEGGGVALNALSDLEIDLQTLRRNVVRQL